jgi:hypothetical protein
MRGHRHVDIPVRLPSYSCTISKPQDSLYRGHRFLAEIISQVIWVYVRFPLSLRMVEDLLAEREPEIQPDDVPDNGRWKR